MAKQLIDTRLIAGTLTFEPLEKFSVETNPFP